MVWRALSLVVVCALLAGSATPGAREQTRQEPQGLPTFTARTELVVVHATVEDGRGAAVPGLVADNFIVYEDNYPQTISFFSSADAPATIGLLIDNSTSMMSKRDRVIASAVGFTELSNPEDEIFVLAFNESVHEAWPPRVIKETELSILNATLKNNISARGTTALYDAILGGLSRLSRGKHARHVLVIISDGRDNASQATVDEMLTRAQSSNALIYTVALNDPVDRDGNPRLLKRIAASTGGESFSPRRIDEVPTALEHIARDIRASYTIGFVPTNQNRDGAMRKLRVNARHPDGRTLTVKSRSAYRAPVATGPGSGVPHGR